MRFLSGADEADRMEAEAFCSKYDDKAVAVWRWSSRHRELALQSVLRTHVLSTLGIFLMFALPMKLPEFIIDMSVEDTETTSPDTHTPGFLDDVFFFLVFGIIGLGLSTTSKAYRRVDSLARGTLYILGEKNLYRSVKSETHSQFGSNSGFQDLRGILSVTSSSNNMSNGLSARGCGMLADVPSLRVDLPFGSPLTDPITLRVRGMNQNNLQMQMAMFIEDPEEAVGMILRAKAEATESFGPLQETQNPMMGHPALQLAQMLGATTAASFGGQQNVGGSWGGGPASAGPQRHSGEDIFTKIEGLKRLLDNGAISQEEFDAKKSELMALM